MLHDQALQVNILMHVSNINDESRAMKIVENRLFLAFQQGK